MQEAVPSALVNWESFYVIVGSSGAALTGLQFVVIAIIADSARRSTSREIEAFGTPTIVHFCAVLLLSAIMSAPWHELSSVALVLDVCALAGLGYGVIVVLRARRTTTYQPVFEDWLWHAILPLISYSLLLVAALLLRSYPQRVLFVIAAVAVLLLFIGIHNSWDTVTYITVNQPQESKESGEQSDAN
jgi:hypothetical protein